MVLMVPLTGKTAPRLINDLLDYDPTQGRNGRNLLAGPAPQYRGMPLPPRKGPLACRHTLMKKESRTVAPVSKDEPPSGEYVVSSYCSLCRCHFTIMVSYLQSMGGQVPCHLSDAANPLHHLQLWESEYSKEHVEKHGYNKYDTVIEAHRFACSAPNCPVIVDIKIAPPRLIPQMLSLFMDARKLKARGEREIMKEPERYQGLAPVQPLQVLSFLRTYLSDAKTHSATGAEKRIAKRNKKYMLSFADECDTLFEYLDFSLQKGEAPDVSVPDLSFHKIFASSLSALKHHGLGNLLY
jgi:ubiquitin carboxyl-terminal hydrolase 25/28